MKANNCPSSITLATCWFVAASVVGVLEISVAAAATLVKQDFSGVVTVAPSGNPFGVSAGSAITGFVIYDKASGDPGAAELSAVEVNFKLGGVTYACSLGNPCKNDTGPGNVLAPARVFFDAKGKLTGITAVLRQPGSVDMPLMIAGGQFFAATVPLCLTKAVCGALNFAASVPQTAAQRGAWPVMGVGPLGIVAVTWTGRAGD